MLFFPMNSFHFHASMMPGIMKIEAGKREVRSLPASRMRLEAVESKKFALPKHLREYCRGNNLYIIIR